MHWWVRVHAVIQKYLQYFVDRLLRGWVVHQNYLYKHVAWCCFFIPQVNYSQMTLDFTPSKAPNSIPKYTQKHNILWMAFHFTFSGQPPGNFPTKKSFCGLHLRFQGGEHSDQFGAHPNNLGGANDFFNYTFFQWESKGTGYPPYATFPCRK